MWAQWANLLKSTDLSLTGVLLYCYYAEYSHFWPPDGSMGHRYVLQLLLSGKSQYANNPIASEASKKICADFESSEFYKKMMYVSLNLKTIKFYFIKLPIIFSANQAMSL
jgi:hypothetical protein